MWKISDKIIRWWYSHDLDQVDDILSKWKIGFIFTRLKFEVATIILSIIGMVKGVSFKHDTETFIRKSFNCCKEGC